MPNYFLYLECSLQWAHCNTQSLHLHEMLRQSACAIRTCFIGLSLLAILHTHIHVYIYILTSTEKTLTLKSDNLALKIGLSTVSLRKMTFFSLFSRNLSLYWRAPLTGFQSMKMSMRFTAAVMSSVVSIENIEQHLLNSNLVRRFIYQPHFKLHIVGIDKSNNLLWNINS